MATNLNPSGTTPKGGRQQRKHPRVAYCARMRLVVGDFDGIAPLTGHVLDLSVGGCAARVHARLEPGDFVRLEFELDDNPMRIPGRVAWTKTDAGSWIVGVRFDQLAPAKQTALNSFVWAEQHRRLY